MRIPHLPEAAGKNYQMEDMDQNDTLDQDDPKIWCLRGNAAALVPEQAQWHLQESSHRCHLSLLSSSCRLMGTSWKIMSISSCPLGAVRRGICTDRDHQGGCSSGGATGLQCTTGKDPDFLSPCSNWTFKQDDYPSIRKTPWSTTT